MVDGLVRQENIIQNITHRKEGGLVQVDYLRND